MIARTDIETKMWHRGQGPDSVRDPGIANQAGLAFLEDAERVASVPCVKIPYRAPVILSENTQLISMKPSQVIFFKYSL